MTTAAMKCWIHYKALAFLVHSPPVHPVIKSCFWQNNSQFPIGTVAYMYDSCWPWLGSARPQRTPYFKQGLSVTLDNPPKPQCGREICFKLYWCMLIWPLNHLFLIKVLYFRLFERWMGIWILIIFIVLFFQIIAGYWQHSSLELHVPKSLQYSDIQYLTRVSIPLTFL